MSRFISIFAILFLSFGCKTTYHYVNTETTLVRVDSTQIAAEQEVEDLIAPYRDKMQAEMDEVIGECSTKLWKGSPESPLGNWIADAFLNEIRVSKKFGSIDFSVANSGGIRIPTIPEGPITRRLIFELMPFNNIIVVQDIKGSELKTFVQHMKEKGGWPVSGELSYRIYNGKVKDLTLNGKPIEDSKSYRMVLPDYIANGGDDCSMLERLPQTSTGILFRDALINEIIRKTGKGEKITATLEDRVLVVNE